MVKLPSTLEKVVSALTPIEETTLLASMEGGAFDSFKRQRPSLAFLAQWPEEKLQRLFSEAMPPEVVALIRVREDLKDIVIKACPTMTARIAEDELAQPDKLKDPEKNQLLAQLSARIKTLVDSKELDLEEIFGGSQDNGGSGAAAA